MNELVEGDKGVWGDPLGAHCKQKPAIAKNESGRGPVQKSDGSWRMTVDLHELNQVMIPIAPAVLGLLSFPEQINMAPGIWYAAIDLAFSPCQYAGSTRVVSL